MPPGMACRVHGVQTRGRFAMTCTCPRPSPLMRLPPSSPPSTMFDSPSSSAHETELKTLATNSAFYTKIGFTYDPPRFDGNGDLIRFYDTGTMLRYHREMFGHGVKLHSSLLFSGWVGDGKFDYSETDHVLSAIASLGPGVRYLPRVKLNVPLDWGRNHPEELCVYFEGPRDREGIRQLVGSLRQDILGYDGDGYYAIGFHDDRPNRNGLIANQSFSSQIWRRDAADALARLIRHVQDSPWHDMIIGWHIAYGNCGETALWGGFNQPVMHTGDFGISHRLAFFDWGLQRHGGLEKLRNAWQLPDLTRENAEPPPPSLRQGDTRDAEKFFRTTPDTQICIDYDRFLCEQDAESLEIFCRTARQLDGKPAGGFYGYYLTLPRAAYAGHCAYDKVLSSPWIDFLCAPAGYHRRGVGEPGGEQVCAQSITRHKLFLDELDLRTHLAQEEPRAANWAGTRYLLWREFSKCLMYHGNFWWMDLGGGWFDSPQIADEIGRLETLALQLRSQPAARSQADILVLSSDEAYLHHRPSFDLQHDLMNETLAELQLCALTIDHYRTSDLPSLPLDQYKMAVVLNDFDAGSSTAALLDQRLAEGVPVLWLYASGATNDTTPSGLRLTAFDPPEQFGIKFGDLPERHFQRDQHRYPMFGLEMTPSRSAEILARYSDGTPVVAECRNDRRPVIQAAAPLLSKFEFRRIIRRFGINARCDGFAACYGDDRFLGIFADGADTFEFYRGKDKIAAQ